MCVEPIFGSYTSKYALVSLGILGFFALFSVISYARASFTNPGYVTKNLDARYYRPYSTLCDRSQCAVYRPPRCYHCRRCDKCVLRLDHHCKWINNCVGLHNHKFFYLFLVYTWLESLSIFALYVGRWLAYVHGIHEPELKVWQVVLLGFATFFDLGNLRQLGWMVYFQTYLISHNRTNVEHSYPSKVLVDFDTNSLFQNWSSVFGSRVYDWWIPIAPPNDEVVRLAR